MSRILLDTNVLLSYVTDRDPQQQETASVLFEAAAAREHELILTQAVSTEMVYVLASYYKTRPSTIAGLLKEVLAWPGLVTHDELVWTTLLELWPERIPDFADAVLAATATTGRFDAIATFDRSFAKRLVREGLSSWWNPSTLR